MTTETNTDQNTIERLNALKAEIEAEARNEETSTEEGQKASYKGIQRVAEADILCKRSPEAAKKVLGEDIKPADIDGETTYATILFKIVWLKGNLAKIDEKKGEISKRVRAVLLARRAGKKPHEVADYVEQEGGPEACARKYRAWKKASDGKFTAETEPQDVTATLTAQAKQKAKESAKETSTILENAFSTHWPTEMGKSTLAIDLDTTEVQPGRYLMFADVDEEGRTKLVKVMLDDQNKDAFHGSFLNWFKPEPAPKADKPKKTSGTKGGNQPDAEPTQAASREEDSDGENPGEEKRDIVPGYEAAA